VPPRRGYSTAPYPWYFGRGAHHVSELHSYQHRGGFQSRGRNYGRGRFQYGGRSGQHGTFHPGQQHHKRNSGAEKDEGDIFEGERQQTADDACHMRGLPQGFLSPQFQRITELSDDEDGHHAVQHDIPVGSQSEVEEQEMKKKEDEQQLGEAEFAGTRRMPGQDDLDTAPPPRRPNPFIARENVFSDYEVSPQHSTSSTSGSLTDVERWRSRSEQLLRESQMPSTSCPVGVFNAAGTCAETNDVEDEVNDIREHDGLESDGVEDDGTGDTNECDGQGETDSVLAFEEQTAPDDFDCSQVLPADLDDDGSDGGVFISGESERLDVDRTVSRHFELIANLTRATEGRLDLLGFQTDYVLERKQFLRYAWTKLSIILLNKTEGTSDEFVTYFLLLKAGRVWRAHVEHYERVAVRMYTRLGGLLDNAIVEFANNDQELFSSDREAIEWFANRLRPKIGEIYEEYFDGEDGYSVARCLWEAQLVALTDYISTHNPDLLEVLEYPHRCQPQWWSWHFDSGLDLPQMPTRPAMPDMDVVEEFLERMGGELAIDIIKPINLFESS
jgi:hypothetical protein